MSEQHHPAADADSSRPTGRRRLLQALALGGVSAAVLPEKWVKPVIDTVIVPAHAQATITTITGIYSNDPQQDVMVPGGIFERLANFVVPSAHAQSSATFPGTQCIAFDFSNNPSVLVRHTDYRPLTFPTYRDETNSTQLFSDNRVQNVLVGEFFFSELAVTPTALSGRVTNTVTNVYAYFSLGPGGVCSPFNPS